MNVAQAIHPAHDAFAQLSDAEAMRSVFQARLFAACGGRLAVSGCEILYTRLKTYRKPESWHKATLSVCYLLDVVDPANAVEAGQILYAKAYRDGRSAAEYVKIDRDSLVRPEYGQSVTHFADLDMIVWAFPNDPAMPHLPELINAREVVRHLPYRSMSAGLDTPADLAGMSVEVVHYRPECRCTIRYELLWGEPDATHTSTLFGKTFSDGQAKAVHERMEYLWQAAQREPERIVVARPLGYCEAVRTVWQEGVPGIRLASVIDAWNCRDYLDATARGLALLHDSGLASPVTILPEGLLVDLRKKAGKIGAAVPRLRERMASLVGRVETGLPDLAASPLKLIHADFHIGQLLAHEGKVVFFDFDEFARGDPAQDLANFIVDLHFHGFDPALVRRMSEDLLEAYQFCGDAAEENVRWHAQVQFANKAYRFYLQQKPRLESEIEWILDAAAAFATDGTRSRAEA